MKRVLDWGLRLVLGGAVVFGALFVYVLAIGSRDEARRADAIVVLGAAHYNGRPSGVLRARLDHAADLYQRGLAPVLVVTGGMAEGDRVSEATVSQQYLVGRKVPDSAVVVLPIGRNTRESVLAAAEWLRDRGHRRVVLVSDPFHMARLAAETRALGLTAYTSPTRTSPISRASGRELRYLAAEAVKLPFSWFHALRMGGLRRLLP